MNAKKEAQRSSLVQCLHNAEKAAADALVNAVRGQPKYVRDYITEAKRLLTHAEELLTIYEKGKGPG